MKPVLLLCFLLGAVTLSAQDTGSAEALQKLPAEKEVVVNHYETVAFSNGMRLNEIEAQYATFLWEGGTIYFDYGQPWKKFKETALTNAAGQKLNYRSGSLAAALNLVHYNGWEVVEHYKSKEGVLTYFLLKKRR